MSNDSELFSLDKRRTKAKKEDLIKDLQAFSKSMNGKPVSATAYNHWKAKRFSQDTFFRKFGTWDRACEIAGVRFLRKGQYSDTELIEHFEKVWRWIDQRVVISDLREYNKTHDTTICPALYQSRWNGFRNFVKLFYQYKHGQITLEQFIASKAGQPTRELISPRLRPGTKTR